MKKKRENDIPGEQRVAREQNCEPAAGEGEGEQNPTARENWREARDGEADSNGERGRRDSDGEEKRTGEESQSRERVAMEFQKFQK